MTQIFLSYRVDDQPFAAAFLDHELTRAFGDDAVFFASRSIPLGADWEHTMFAAVSASDAVLVVIGPRWLTATDDDGRHRLTDPQDFVRREVESALRLEKLLIPVHLERRHRLVDDRLPASLRPLADKQSTVVRFRNSKPDLDGLVTRLRRQIPSLRAVEPGPGPAANTGGHDSGGMHTTVHGDVNGAVVNRPIGGIYLGGTRSGA